MTVAARARPESGNRFRTSLLPKYARKPRRERPPPRDLLAWYDRHRRVLPWRAKPGEAIDPYRVWLSEIMLQQTTVKTVGPYFARFVARWPDVGALAAAPLDDVLRLWAGLGYYARARNLHACARAVAERGGFPRTEAELTTLPGIGRYTAAAIASIAFDEHAVPVDGNVERVVTRLFADRGGTAGGQAGDSSTGADADAGRAHRRLRAGADGPRRHHLHAGEAGLRALPLDGRLRGAAARRSADAFRARRRSGKGKLRRGAAFVVVRADGCVLLRSRPPKGLLGGMTEVPTTDWSHDFDDKNALKDAPRLSRAAPKWQRLPGVVTHVFTHFPLELVVYAAKVPRNAERAGRRALDFDRCAKGRGAADRHAQGARACA